MIKVSVIITTFNAEKTIARTLQSVITQSGAGIEFWLEIIVVDDCSTDSTADILKTFDIHFYYRTPVNSGGPNKGRNIGLKNATGDYICFIDHDDVWCPNKVKEQLNAAFLAPIITSEHVIGSDVDVVSSEDGDHLRVFKTDETFLKKLAREKQDIQNTYLSSIMIHSSLKDILFEEHFGMIDYDYILRLFENRSSVEITRPLVVRYVHGKNLSLNPEYRKRDYYYSLMCLESFEKKYANEVSLARKRINGSRARYCYLMGEMDEARKYLLRSRPGIREMLYYLTSFVGSEWVKKRFIVFG